MHLEKNRTPALGEVGSREVREFEFTECDKSLLEEMQEIFESVSVPMPSETTDPRKEESKSSKPAPRETRTRRRGRSEVSTEQQVQSLTAMGNLIELRQSQVMFERQVRDQLRQAKQEMEAQLRYMHQDFQNCLRRVRTYVACVVVHPLRRRSLAESKIRENAESKIRESVNQKSPMRVRVQMVNVSIEELMSELNQGGLSLAYVATLDYGITHTQFRKWMLSHGVRRRHGYYTLESNQLDAYLVEPADVGYGETGYWTIAM